MAYLVLARKYRPQNFEDVIKQEHVTLTLKNAIASNRMAHAVLFSGPRGTGKTTVARILAKAMNCEKGPSPTPCNVCKSCNDIKASGSVDVYEIDGASNNGVEQVRELRDNIKYMPAHSRYKIYIIDEVHMLSTAAFNALLKTLEEPPPHVLFIFATTEPHKIPLTILSRCRRHDFRRIPIEDITKHLERICQKENFEVDTQSLHLMAREAGGCMRDAMSLLDQVITCSRGGLPYDQVINIMGVIDRKVIFDITTGIINADVPKILTVLDEVYDRGQDMKKLYADILEHFRNLVVVKMGKNLDKLVDVPANELKMMSEQAADISDTHIGQLFDVLFREEPTVKFSSQPKMALEMALIRMCRLKPVLSIDELIEKLDHLKNGLGSETSDSVVSETKKNKKNYENAAQIKKAEIGEVEVLGNNYYDEEKDGSNVNNYYGTKNIAGNKVEETPFDWKQSPESIWEKIVKIVSENYGVLGTMLSKALPVTISKELIEIESTDNGLQFSRINKNLDKIKDAFKALTGNKPEIVLKANDNNQTNYQNRTDHENRLKQEALNHPIIAEAMEIFDGKIIDVTILKEDYS
ncbi:MAG: DNA polymerase III subunit gamma/tau [Desulfobacterales bacterium]